MCHEQTKDIDVQPQFVQDIVADKIVIMSKIDTAHNPLDMLTKPVPTIKFKYCLYWVGVYSS